MPIAIVRAVAIFVSVWGIGLGLLFVYDDPTILSAFAGKLVEGGLWTGLALFVLLAVCLGCWPRDAEGRLRGLRQR